MKETHPYEEQLTRLKYYNQKDVVNFFLSNPPSNQEIMAAGIDSLNLTVIDHVC